MPIPIGREQLHQLVSGGAQVVEVLPVDEYRAGHLPGALSIPLKELADRSGELDRTRAIVVYCYDFQ